MNQFKIRINTHGRTVREGNAPSVIYPNLKISRRLDRLMETGVITGFTVRLRDDAISDKVRAVMMVEVHGKSTASVVRELRSMPGIVQLHSTNGAWDLVAEIEVGNLVDFDRVLNKVRLVDGISKTDTSLLLAGA